MSDDLAHCKAELKRINAEIRRYEKEPDRASGQLLLLVAQSALQDLLKHMRGQQASIKNKRSRSTKANQVASAYSQLNQFRKTNKG
ncbi:hypothetical protein [uncultured Cohaesibacter sp.]|uniref:hypothetical protein n=1 Tax=uncultured Cohaesibacter sp. TaxID=1002546 RepID=UPI002A0A8956|nr:hypothetical protein [uncultured Cohaesibacter sp.]